jgi:hypothetical protein
VAIRIDSAFRQFLDVPVLELAEMMHVWVFQTWVRESLPTSNLGPGRPRFPFVAIASPACIVEVVVGTDEIGKLAFGLEMFNFENLVAAQVLLRALTICAPREKIPAQERLVFPIVGLSRRVFSAGKERHDPKPINSNYFWSFSNRS